MQDFNDIQNLYKNAEEINLPSAQEILSKVESVRKKIMMRNILGIVMLSTTFSFIIWIAAHYDFEKTTTPIGIVLTLIAIVLGIVFNTKLANSILSKTDPTLDNNKFLQQLIEYRNQQRKVQTKGITFYFIVLIAGLILYMYEFAARDLQFGIIAYTLTLGWIAFNWFYIRKKTMAKQEKQINEQIASIEELIARMEK